MHHQAVMERSRPRTSLLMKCSLLVIFISVVQQAAQAQNLFQDCNIGDRISCWLPCLPCPHRPHTQCRHVQVGCGCEKAWFENGQRVSCTPTEQRNNTSPTPAPQPIGECPSGVSRVQCLVNPCDVTSCQRFPDAACRPNYCGGCFAEFFLDGRRVNCTMPLGHDVTNVTTESPNRLTTIPLIVTSATQHGSLKGSSLGTTTPTTAPTRRFLSRNRFLQGGTLRSVSGEVQASGTFEIPASASVVEQPEAGQKDLQQSQQNVTTLASPTSSGGQEASLRTTNFTTLTTVSSNVRETSLPVANANSNSSVTTTSSPVTSARICGENEFLCTSGECILSKRTCDAQADCIDGSDEAVCAAAACGAGVKRVTCAVDPCAGQTCDVAGAQCRAGSCGSCHAEWYIGDNVVQCQQVCSLRVMTARCPINPCAIQSCEAFPEAVCRIMTCGACRAEWFVGGRRVTHQCLPARSVDECPRGQEPTCRCDRCPSQSAASCRIRGCGNSCRLEYYTVNNGQEETVRCRGVFFQVFDPKP